MVIFSDLTNENWIEIATINMPPSLEMQVKQEIRIRSNNDYGIHFDDRGYVVKAFFSGSNREIYGFDSAELAKEFLLSNHYASLLAEIKCPSVRGDWRGFSDVEMVKIKSIMPKNIADVIEVYAPNYRDEKTATSELINFKNKLLKSTNKDKEQL